MRPYWHAIFEDAVAPHLSTAGLHALERCLHNDDARLLQGSTTQWILLEDSAPCQGACLLALPFWLGDHLVSVDDVEDAWVNLCGKVAASAGEVAVEAIVCWWDTTPRAEAIALLLPVVRGVLAKRLADEAEYEYTEAMCGSYS